MVVAQLDVTPIPRHIEATVSPNGWLVDGAHAVLVGVVPLFVEAGSAASVVVVSGLSVAAVRVVPI